MQPDPTLAWTSFRLRIRRRDIGQFQNMLEGYENFADLRIVDGKGGVLEVFLPQANLEDFKRLLDGIQETLPWTPVEQGWL